ncbi:hypothetical protein ACEPPN_010990 [Leptodophora sp. 'Broadleaf-Isolate-01']
MINKYDLDALFVSSPGHGAPATLSQAYLEGTYPEVSESGGLFWPPRHSFSVYSDKAENEEGMPKFFKQFSFPGGVGSHATPETPGSIHEGVVGDGEAETGPLATSWHSAKFLNPITDGAVLPVLQLNGYKINNPTILARVSHKELEALFVGYGWTPHFVEGSDLDSMHEAMATTVEHYVKKIKKI